MTNKSGWNSLKNWMLFTVLSGAIGLLVLILLDLDTGRFDQNVGTFGENDSVPISNLVQAISELDACFEREWASKKLTSAGAADDLLVARRVSLALVGTIPSLEEIRQLEQIPAGRRIYWWVDRLLKDKRSSDFLAERLARVLVGVEDGPFLIYRRRRFVAWLSEELRVNRPYDQLVRELVTASGLWTDQPQVNFLTRTIDQNISPENPDPILLAGRTSRAFLGMRIDCLQCHDDFLGNVNVGAFDSPREGTQEDFHSLAAFFHQPENSLTGIWDNPEAKPYGIKLLDEEQETTLEPRVPILEGLIDPSITNPRQRLAAWITHIENRVFARATVNRLWAILFGQALVQPVDDIPIDGPFPAAMELLVDDFIEHNYDLHRLIRLIVLSRPYSIGSSANFDITADHESHWAVFPLTRLRPEQMAGSMMQSTRLKTIDTTSHILIRLARFGQQNEFVQRYGDSGENEFQDRGETVTQRLLLFNGDMIAENIDNGLTVPIRLNQIATDSAKAVETIFLSTLTRRPTLDELQRFMPCDHRTTSISEQLRDLYWSTINSAEFRWNH